MQQYTFYVLPMCQYIKLHTCTFYVLPMCQYIKLHTCTFLPPPPHTHTPMVLLCCIIHKGMLSVLTLNKLPAGAHMNPAMSLAFAVHGRLPWRQVPSYVLAQMCGSFLASVLCFGVYYGESLVNLYYLSCVLECTMVSHLLISIISLL